MNPIKFLLTAGLAMWAAMAAADEPHFTFTVPLALSNLPPEVNGYRVTCVVTQSGAGGIAGRGETSGPISGGGFSGEAVVPVAVAAPGNPGLVDEYYCSLHLTGTLDGRRHNFMDDSYTRFPLTAGAPFRQRASGPLPR